MKDRISINCFSMGGGYINIQYICWDHQITKYPMTINAKLKTISIIAILFFIK
jgi:hypothetical protein